MKTEIINNNIAITWEHDSETLLLNKEDAEALVTKLNDLVNKIEKDDRHEKYSNIGQKAEHAANEYYNDCMYTYHSRGSDYDHGPIFEYGAEAMIKGGVFDDLDKIQLTSFILYLMSLDEYMDLPVSVLMYSLLEKGI